MFRIALDWTPPNGGSVQTWQAWEVPDSGFARFRCEKAGIELYVDATGMVELREITDSAAVLYRRLSPDDPVRQAEVGGS